MLRAQHHDRAAEENRADIFICMYFSKHQRNGGITEREHGFIQVRLPAEAPPSKQQLSGCFSSTGAQPTSQSISRPVSRFMSQSLSARRLRLCFIYVSVCLLFVSSGYVSVCSRQQGTSLRKYYRMSICRHS